VGWAVRLAKHLESLHVHGVAHGSVSPACVASDGAHPADRGVVLDVRKMAPNVAFHSPERVRSGQISPQDDAWALGCTLYALLTATMPFQGANEPEIRDRILAGAAPPLAVYGVDDENLQRIVGGGIAREPSHRYASLAQMRSDLERWAPSSASLDALEDEGDADEDQAATTMLPMQDAFRAVAALRPAARPAAAPPAPRPAAGAPPPSVPRPIAPPPPAAPPPPRPAPPSAPPALADDASGDGLYEEPEFDQEHEKQDETVMRELPAHIMALAARSAAGSTPPPPRPEGPIPSVQVPRPPASPNLTPHAPMPAVAFGALPPPGGLPPGGLPPAPRPEPLRPAAAALARPAGAAAPPAPPPGAAGDSDEDDVRTVYAVHTAAELAELERKGPAAPNAPPAPPPPMARAAPPPTPPQAGGLGLPNANPVDDDDEDDAVRTVIRDPGPPQQAGLSRPGPPAPPPPAAGRTFKSTQLGMGAAISNPNAAAPPMGVSPNAWSPAAAPGGPRPNLPGGQLAEAPLGQLSSTHQPTPSSGIRLGAPEGAGTADVSALIQNALGTGSGSFASGSQPGDSFDTVGSTDSMKNENGAPFGSNDPSMGGGPSGFGNPTSRGAPGQAGFPNPNQGFPGAPGHGFPGQGGFPQPGNPGYPGGPSQGNPQSQSGPGGFGMAPDQSFQQGGFPGQMGPGGPNMGSQGMGPQGFGVDPQSGGFGQPGLGSPNQGFPGQFGQDPSSGAFGGDPSAPSSGMAPGSQGAQIPAHLLAPPGQVGAGTTSSMRTWYVVCVLAMMLVAAVTFIALRFMSG